MSDNLVLEMLRAVRGDIAEIKTEQREQRGRTAAMERNLAHLDREISELPAEIGGQFDRVLDRLERIERRLDLRDAQRQHRELYLHLPILDVQCFAVTNAR